MDGHRWLPNQYQFEDIGSNSSSSSSSFSDMFFAAPLNSYTGEQNGHYCSTSNPYYRYPESSRRDGQGQNWNWRERFRENLNFYPAPRRTFGDIWGSANRGFGMHPNMNTATPRAFLGIQPENQNLPHQRWNGGGNIPGIGGMPYQDRFGHQNVEEWFGPTAYNVPRQVHPNPPTSPPTTAYIADSEPDTPRTVGPSNEPAFSTAPFGRYQNEEQPRIPQRQPFYNSHNREIPESGVPNNPLSDTLTALQKCVQELKRERGQLRLERKSLHSLNSQFRSMICWLKKVGNRQQRGGGGEGCRCRGGNKKGKHARQGGGREEGQFEQQGENRTSVPQGDVGLDGLSDIGRPAGGTLPSVLDRYNAAWQALKMSGYDFGIGLAIPWPTADLHSARLGHYDFYDDYSGHDNESAYGGLPLQIIKDPFQLQKWNAFCFFVGAFGFSAYYAFEPVIESPSLNGRHWRDQEQERTVLLFHNNLEEFGGRADDVSRSRLQLEALKAQMQQEKLRWHPDRLRLKLPAGMLADEEMESAKAVWGAVVQVSQSCDDCLGMVRG